MAELTPRDREILEALTLRVRVLTVPQIARTWWAMSKNALANAKDRLSILELLGFLTIYRAPAHPEIRLLAPVTTWKPGEQTPDLGASSYQLQTRWNQDPVMIHFTSATRKAANFFAGHGGRAPREIERTHDIHLASVYLFYRANFPSLLPQWTFEEQIRRERRHTAEMLPDVLLRLNSGLRAVEFGGAYPKTKLEAFHRYCEEQSLPYEIW